MPRPEVICPEDCERHHGDFADFDHYADSVNATDDELPAVFGAWLHHSTGWDGKMEQIK